MFCTLNLVDVSSQRDHSRRSCYMRTATLMDNWQICLNYAEDQGKGKVLPRTRHKGPEGE
jgi:hypothetical protein